MTSGSLIIIIITNSNPQNQLSQLEVNTPMIECKFWEGRLQVYEQQRGRVQSGTNSGQYIAMFYLGRGQWANKLYGTVARSAPWMATLAKLAESGDEDDLDCKQMSSVKWKWKSGRAEWGRSAQIWQSSVEVWIRLISSGVVGKYNERQSKLPY